MGAKGNQSRFVPDPCNSGWDLAEAGVGGWGQHMETSGGKGGDITAGPPKLSQNGWGPRRRRGQPLGAGGKEGAQGEAGKRGGGGIRGQAGDPFLASLLASSSALHVCADEPF
ncbi:hypothetical protein ABBQ32_007307 [Trebouxia sp. C0010 RCD-2024]